MLANVGVRAAQALTPLEAAAVRALVNQAAEKDGYAALNEAGLLHLQHPRSGVLHLLAQAAPEGGAALIGYGQLDGTADVDTGQLVVAPAERRRGVANALLTQLLEAAPRRLHVWATSDAPAARGLAASVGLAPVRELLVMRRSLAGLPPAAALPTGTTVRSFVPGQDEAAWLAVNARAFASHPEQGSVGPADLAERMAEPWFDPAGFLLAHAGSALVGYHWTKRHSATLGEVYVLGVDPGAGGRGLGSALLDLGLRHLADAGLEEVQLYVEGDHERAVALYRGRGFEVTNRDVMYARP